MCVREGLGVCVGRVGVGGGLSFSCSAFCSGSQLGQGPDTLVGRAC